MIVDSTATVRQRYEHNIKEYTPPRMQTNGKESIRICILLNINNPHIRLNGLSYACVLYIAFHSNSVVTLTSNSHTCFGSFSSWRTFREGNNVSYVFPARSHAKPAIRSVNRQRRLRRRRQQQ